MLGENVLIGAMLGVNVSSECGNVRSECFDRCNLMLRINIWRILMLIMNIWGMLMLGVNVGMREC